MKIAFYLPDGGRYSKNIVTFSQFNNSKSEGVIFLQNDNTMMGKKACKYKKEEKNID